MAIATILKMRVIKLQPAVGGQPEIVELRESLDNDTAKTNIRKMPSAQTQPKAEMTIKIDNAAGQGAFALGTYYVVSFTATT